MYCLKSNLRVIVGFYLGILYFYYHCFTRYDPLRYNPLIAAAAYRAEEEEHRAKLFGYHHPQAHLRPKDPSPNTHRQMPPDMQLPKKEESSQSR